jgi:hypothetical protein
MMLTSDSGRFSEDPQHHGGAGSVGRKQMPRATTFWTASVMGLLLAPAVRAEHAKINLEVATSRDSVSAFVDQTPPAWGKNPRPVLKAKVNEPLRIQFLIENVYPHKTLENVVVHFYIARQKTVGQKELPDLKGDVVLETAFDMDFKPHGKAGQKSTAKIDKAGVYLIRLETRNTQSDHEHFAAIDLVVSDEAKP